MSIGGVNKYDASQEWRTKWWIYINNVSRVCVESSSSEDALRHELAAKPYIAADLRQLGWLVVRYLKIIVATCKHSQTSHFAPTGSSCAHCVKTILTPCTQFSLTLKSCGTGALLHGQIESLALQ